MFQNKTIVLFRVLFLFSYLYDILCYNYLSVDENKVKEVTCFIVKILLFDESLQLWLQVLMLGIVEHQTFISILKRYNCMVFACSKAINLIRMIC